MTHVVWSECFFWYRLTRVVPDNFHRAVKRLCVCVCVVWRHDVSEWAVFWCQLTRDILDKGPLNRLLLFSPLQTASSVTFCFFFFRLMSPVSSAPQVINCVFVILCTLVTAQMYGKECRFKIVLTVWWLISKRRWCMACVKFKIWVQCQLCINIIGKAVTGLNLHQLNLLKDQ